MSINLNPFFCTKGLARYTGLSPSYFEKGRVYGYGPPYYKAGGAVRYRKSEVDEWLESLHRLPGAHAVVGRGR
jgi:predicted DNA-binding transcriptional regulator AlpA